MCYAFKRHAFFDILLVIHDKDSIPPLQRPWPSAAVDLFGFLLIAALLRLSLHRLTGPIYRSDLICVGAITAANACKGRLRFSVLCRDKPASGTSSASVSRINFYQLSSSPL